MATRRPASSPLGVGPAGGGGPGGGAPAFHPQNEGISRKGQEIVSGIHILGLKGLLGGLLSSQQGGTLLSKWLRRRAGWGSLRQGPLLSLPPSLPTSAALHAPLWRPWQLCAPSAQPKALCRGLKGARDCPVPRPPAGRFPPFVLLQSLGATGVTVGAQKDSPAHTRCLYPPGARGHRVSGCSSRGVSQVLAPHGGRRGGTGAAWRWWPCRTRV